MPIQNLPTDRGARFVAPTAFTALNRMFGPDATDRAANADLIRSTLHDADDDPGRYAAMQSQIPGYDSADGADLAQHVNQDLIEIDPDGWRDLNRHISDAVRQVAADPSYSFAVTVELVDVDDPGDAVDVVAHDLGRFRLIRWRVGQAWADRLGALEPDGTFGPRGGSKLTDEVPIATMMLDSLDSTPPRP